MGEFSVLTVSMSFLLAELLYGSITTPQLILAGYPRDDNININIYHSMIYSDAYLIENCERLIILLSLSLIELAVTPNIFSAVLETGIHSSIFSPS